MRHAQTIPLAICHDWFLGASWYPCGLILNGVKINGDTGEYDNQVTVIPGSRSGATESSRRSDEP